MNYYHDPTKNAKREALKRAGEYKTKSRWTKERKFIAYALQSASPSLFINIIQTIYVVMIFRLYSLHGGIIWKVFIFAVAFTQIRNWFYMLYMTAGLKLGVKQIENPPDEEDDVEQDDELTALRTEHWHYGRARVADTCNDMNVKYITTILGAYLIYKFSDSGGPFILAGSSEEVSKHSLEAIMEILAYELVPGLFVDFYCTLLEIKGGLMPQHGDYWKRLLTSEGMMATTLKILWTPCVVADTVDDDKGRPHKVNSSFHKEQQQNLKQLSTLIHLLTDPNSAHEARAQ